MIFYPKIEEGEQLEAVLKPKDPPFKNLEAVGFLREASYLTQL